ncbi:MAG: ATP-binding protein [Desulfosporosinus sp.]|nr:ATP-binding protein [Desulfosporosinus sp.]
MLIENEFLVTYEKGMQLDSSKEFDTLKSVFHNSTYAFATVAFNGRIRYINSVLPKILGANQDSFLNQKAGDVAKEYVHPNDLNMTINALGDVIKGQRINGIENRYRTPNGSYIWLSWMLIPFVEQKMYYAIAHEVTERKKLEKSLEDEQKRLYAILNGLPGLVYLRTSEGKVIFANHTFKEIHGEPDNRKCYCILLNKDEPCSNCHTESTSGTKILKQWQCVIKDTIFEVFQHPFQDSDGTQLFLMQLFDITKRKIAEEEMARLDRLNLVGELAASIAHEVRNPMTTVRGFLQILNSRDTLHENSEFYDLMISELDRANGIITEFLSIAKTKTGSYTSVRLNNLVDSLYPLIHADATNQDKKVVLETEEVPELTINEREIRQLILNLTRNGFEAMLARGILKIMIYSDANSIVLAVQDQGTGIREDIIARLGTPFLTTKEGGTGLGLATCYNIAERHNAKIDVKSSSSGTTFFVRFQLR